MNITHAVTEEYSGDKLMVIFARQEELMAKYHDIEARSGLLQTEDNPVNLDDKRGQARIKDFSWRIMEEVGEALDAQGDTEHFVEELIDGLHFLTELTILSGVSFSKGIIPYADRYGKNEAEPKDMLEALFEVNGERYTGQGMLEARVTSLVKNLGMMCNCLKNKPWKQTNMVTDKPAFYNRLQSVWVDYIALLMGEMSPDDVVEIYLKKSQVNKFRQRSNY